MTDKEVNEATARFLRAMEVVQETLPIVKGAYLDGVPMIQRLMELYGEAEAMEKTLDAKRQEIAVALKAIGVEVDVRPVSIIGAQVVSLVKGWKA